MNSESQEFPGAQQYLINPHFRPGPIGIGRGPTVGGATEVLPGWWLIQAAEQSAVGAVVPRRGRIRFRGEAGTRLVAPLSAPVRGGSLRARLRVTRGEIALAATNQFGNMPTAVLRDGSWQTVELGVEANVDQVMLTINHDETEVDLEWVQLSAAIGPSALATEGIAQTMLLPRGPDIRSRENGNSQRNSPVGHADQFPARARASIAAAAGAATETHDNHAASVKIEGADPTPVIVGRQFTVSSIANEGIVWSSHRDKAGPGGAVTVWTSEPAVIFAGSWRLDFDTGESGTAVLGTGIPVTLTTFGIHTATARAGTTDGREIVSEPLRFVSDLPNVSPASPQPGEVFSLPETGSASQVRVTIASSGAWPDLKVRAHDDADGNSAELSSDGDSWSGWLALGGTIGTRTITFSASVAVGQILLKSQATVAITVTDTTPPLLLVRSPSRGASIVWDDDRSDVLLTGTVTDKQSGPASVETSLDLQGPWHPATLVQGPDPTTATWTATETLTELGEASIYVRATDRSNNTTATPLRWPVKAVGRYLPTSLADRLNGTYYLAALVAFAADQVQAGGNALETKDLEDALGQPVTRLSDPASTAKINATDQINELVVPVELLRQYLATLYPDLEQEPVANYVVRSYAALLGALGTSYDEIRFARTADDDTRQELARRLGIALQGPDGVHSRPDQLDKLAIPPSALTEQDLEDIFGMIRTNPDLDRLRPPLPPPLLLGWKRQAQRIRWSTDEAAGFPGQSFTIILDPDVVTKEDIRPDGPSPETLKATLDSHMTELDSIQKAVSKAIQTAKQPPAQLAAALTAAQCGFTSSDILAWNEDEVEGRNIDAFLGSAGLERAGFEWLTTITELTTKDLSPTPDEWSTTVDVLVGAYRRRSYPKWKAAEAGLLLDPDQFEASTLAPDRAPLRISAVARSDWVNLLTTRTLQRDSVIASSTEIVATAWKVTLPLLRDQLLQALAQETGDSPADLGETLTRRLQIDLLASGTLTSSRLSQVTTSVQTLLQLIRAQAVPEDAPEASWTLASKAPLSQPEDFDQGWKWLGSADTWRQAVTGFLFPEAHLPPDQIDSRTDGFDTLRTKLRGKSANSSTIASDLGEYVKKAVPALKAAANDIALPDPFKWLSDRNSAHQEKLADCSRKIASVNEALAREVFWAVPALVAQTLVTAGDYQLALDWLWVLYPDTSPSTSSCFHQINDERDNEPSAPDLTMSPGWTRDLNPLHLINRRPAPFLRSTLLSTAAALINYGDSEFAAETPASIALATTLYQRAVQILSHERLAPITPENPDESKLPIPQLDTLRLRARNQLAKIRQGRNIAGLARAAVIPSTESAGQPVSQPTLYRYRTLIDRAQQQAQQAAQFEAQYLSLIERYDKGTLQLEDAIFAAGLTRLQEDAATDRVAEAEAAKKAADSQVEKANTMVKTYEDEITKNQTPQETALLTDYAAMRDMQDIIATTETVMSAAQFLCTSCGADKLLFSAGQAAVAAGVGVGASAVRGATQMRVNELQRRTQADALRNGIEERRRRLTMEHTSAKQDQAVAEAGQVAAAARMTVATDEQTIAAKQADHAADMLALLSRQFTQPDLYQWMSVTLGGIYQYFLQTATATARLAQSQLAFDRGEPAPSFIAGDYWIQPGRVDARGMTGAERLIADLSRLGQYAFETDARQLNITVTLSLAQLFPQEFLTFRRTGAFTFTTPTALFDQEFPGHYLRMIKQVQLSLVALVPPVRGIRATLSASGISRIVARDGDGVFATRIVRREPTTIVATSPSNATGVFAMDLQSELVRPFEGSGVDTSWQLDLPAAANPFSFDSIADVLLTVDYTALRDADYQAQVTAALNTQLTRRSDRIFSFARDFPDQWYSICNPMNGKPRTAEFALSESDFPIGLRQTKITDVALRLVSDASTAPATFTFTLTPPPPPPPAPAPGPIGGTTKSAQDGIASTRRGAAEWGPLVGSSPIGSWRLSVDTTDTGLFEQKVSDIVFIISWQGESPAWPT